eukprot:1137265-Pelagomonas_calceolata.AAC.1
MARKARALRKGSLTSKLAKVVYCLSLTCSSPKTATCQGLFPRVKESHHKHVVSECKVIPKKWDVKTNLKRKDSVETVVERRKRKKSVDVVAHSNKRGWSELAGLC